MPAAGEISRRTAPRNDSTRQNRELLIISDNNTKMVPKKATLQRGFFVVENANRLPQTTQMFFQ